jgi:hypothetical protein
VYVFGLAVHFDQLSLEVAPGWWFYPSGSLKRTFHRLVQPDISCANDDANEYWTYSHKNSSLAHFTRGNADAGRNDDYEYEEDDELRRIDLVRGVVGFSA